MGPEKRIEWPLQGTCPGGALKLLVNFGRGYKSGQGVTLSAGVQRGERHSGHFQEEVRPGAKAKAGVKAMMIKPASEA